MLISLWMHSVFCSFTPLEWKDELMKALEEVDLEDTMRWIENAKVDQWANDWGDQLAHPDRPLFRDWTTISLYPGASQPLNEGVSQPQAVGSAILLSSVRLKPRYIAMVRPWIRSVYGLLLGVDAAIQTHNRNVELAKRNAQSLALVAGPWIGHEITNIFKTTFGRVAYEMDSSDPEAVRLRKQAWDTLRVITQLSDLVGKAVTRGSIKEEIELIRKRFIEPLAREMAKGQQRLVDAIFAVARQVYENARRGDARIPELENRNSGRCRDIEDIDADVYGHGLVLVHEMIANFRSHTRRPDPDAHFTVSCDGRRLTITLEARSEGQKFESESFKLLGFFFETAGVGKAVLQWFEEEKRYRYKIDVSVREEEHHETATSPSRVTGQ